MRPANEGEVQLVYRPKDDAERMRILKRTKALLGTPWVSPSVPLHKVMFIVDGHKIRAEALGMVFNDAALADAISNWGEDGPLYRDTLDDNPIQAKAYDAALELYAGLEIPPQLKNPNTRWGHPPPRTANEAGRSN